MKRSVHKAIVETIENTEFDYHVCLEVLIEKFPKVRKQSLSSILSQEHQKRVKRSYGYQTSAAKRKENARIYKERLQQQGKSPDEAGIIVKIAKQNRFSATLTAKALLVDHLTEKHGKPPPKQQVSQLMKDSNLIEDSKLAVEVFKATLFDENYGFLAECTKRTLGCDYERRLKRHLRNLNISYQDEHDLRAAGYDKTPDVKLDIPISVNGSVVNWIESKALFGDEENHTAYLNDQLWSYWNRFGPGMVIYWCGYLKHLEWSTEHGILVRETFPTEDEIIFFEPTKGIFDSWTSEEDETSSDSSDEEEENKENQDKENKPEDKDEKDIVQKTNALKLQ